MKVVAMAISLTACAAMPAFQEPTGPCGMNDAIRGRYIGTKFREAARQPMQRDTNSRIARVLRPGDAATMDFRADRLNVLVDDGGQIEGLRCG